MFQTLLARCSVAALTCPYPYVPLEAPAAIVKYSRREISTRLLVVSQLPMLVIVQSQ